jgi:phage terminase large subunit-like protein
VLWTQQQARPSQIEPEGTWKTWLILSGRGWGKTRTGAEWLAWQAIYSPKTRWAILAPTFGSARDTCIEGDSGVLTILRRYGALREENGYNRSNGELWLSNGSRIKTFSADNPERLRGPQFHGAWVDELAAFAYPEAWDQLQFGLRLGETPRAVVTTTPKPKPLIRGLIARQDGTVTITRGSTFDNKDNLAESALVELQLRYANTRLGRQELYGEVLDDVEGALWTQGMIDDARVEEMPRDLQRIVVAIDPAVTNTADSDETGIIVAGKNTQAEGFVLADFTCKASPLEWAKKAVSAYYKYAADAIVVEVNNGGDMIPAIIRQIDPVVNVKSVRATRGKRTRAEPVAAFYEQGRVHHVGNFDKLEMQLTTWTPEEPHSPDRLDALVWALTDLLEGSPLTGYLSNLAQWCDTCNLPMPKNQTVCSNCASPLSESDDTRHVLGV